MSLGKPGHDVERFFDSSNIANIAFLCVVLILAALMINCRF